MKTYHRILECCLDVSPATKRNFVVEVEASENATEAEIMRLAEEKACLGTKWFCLKNRPKEE